MLTILMQALTFFSGLLVNFVIPVCWGVGEYGLFIKENIFVLMFHKLADLISEPLISLDGNVSLFSNAIVMGAFLLTLFWMLSCIAPISMGSGWLLGCMVWSNCVLIVMHAKSLHRWIVFYLILFIFFFLLGVIVRYYHFYEVTIVQILELTNLVPAVVFFMALCLGKKIELSFLSFKATASNLISILKVTPKLFSLTLVNNLFTNILPCYVSFVFTPQALGLFKIQMSIAQMAVVVFPVSAKVISFYFYKYNSKLLLESTLRLSINYFSFIALCAYAYIAGYEKKFEISHIVLLLPVIHVSVILERYLLGSALRNRLIAINWYVAIISCLVIVCVHTLSEMIFLYSFSIVLYVFLMLTLIESSLSKLIIMSLSALSCALGLISYYSMGYCLIGLSVSVIVLFIFFPIHKNMLIFSRENT